MNKYLKSVEEIYDLHGYTKDEAQDFLDRLLKETPHSYVRIITGRGAHSENGPVLRSFVQHYFSIRGIHFNRAKIGDGGEGAIDVFLK